MESHKIIQVDEKVPFNLCDKYKHESANAIHEKNDGWIDSE